MNWNRRIATLAGLALLALTNAVALGGAAWNRSGEPDATLHLTQRELDPPFLGSDPSENSGMALRLRWRTLPPATGKEPGLEMADDGGAFPAWLDAGKLASLGWPTPTPRHGSPRDAFERARWQPSLSVLIVLELDGPATQEALRRTEAYVAYTVAHAKSDVDKQEVQGRLARERDTGSRLFAIDAGLDAAALRAKYPDRARYAIVRGRIDPVLTDDDGRRRRGRIASLGADEINVPRAWRSVFEGNERRFDEGMPVRTLPFDATVAFGQRFEPWLVTAARH